jgi:general L-amino acid transport system permease protein
MKIELPPGGPSCAGPRARPKPSAKALLWQGLALALVVWVVWAALDNAYTNLRKQDIPWGFGFLVRPAGFSILQSLIPYGPASTYGRAFIVGILNTLLVASTGIVLATVLGVTLGVMRLSRNWLGARLAWVYVEAVRNIPLLLQILFWYFAVLRRLPPPQESLSFAGMIFLNNRGLYLPNPFTFELPALTGFNVTGGLRILPEFAALTLALSLYTAAFIGETVRAGLQATPIGQTEAAYALGLRPGLALRLVVLPQALRQIIPPLTSQYLNLTKNSSLAVAIGYPDLVSVFAGTVLNQTGQAVEALSLTMAVYLALSLLIAGAMNLVNARQVRLTTGGRAS